MVLVLDSGLKLTGDRIFIELDGNFL